MNKQHTLGKTERLKSRKKIEQLFMEGKSFVVPPFRIYHRTSGRESMKNAENGLQFGTGVSNKSFKKAVDRNRIKRLTREAWRLQNSELKDKMKQTGKQLHVFFIYTGKEIPDYKLVSEKIKTAVQKLLMIVDQKG